MQQPTELQVPQNFFGDVCLQPNFYMPENEELRWATHNSIRKTLFYNAFRAIKNIEFKRLKGQDDFFQFVRLDRTRSGWTDSLLDRWRHRKDLLLDVHLWEINRSGKSIKYRVRYYQTDGDEFQATIWPESWRDALTHLRVNRTAFRII